MQTDRLRQWQRQADRQGIQGITSQKPDYISETGEEREREREKERERERERERESNHKLYLLRHCCSSQLTSPNK